MSPNASTPPNKQSLDYIVRSGIAGGVAGCVAKTVVAPLDRVKILFQASNPDFQKYAGTWSGAFRAGAEIYKEGGGWALFQGHSATLIRVFPYAAIKFMAYDQVHHFLMPTHADETNLKRFTAGALSGTITVFLTYPLELIRVRMAFQTRNSNPSSPFKGTRPSFLQAAKYLYHEGASAPASIHAPIPPSSTPPPSTTKELFHRFPILKFYRGFTVTIAGMIPYAGTSFLVWGFLRSHLLPPREGSQKKRTPVADLTFGAVAGAISQTVSYPFEIVRRRMQVGGLRQPDRWLGWSETVRDVWRANGWRGFYVGLGIGYLKVVPMTAVSFAVWQAGKHVLGV